GGRQQRRQRHDGAQRKQVEEYARGEIAFGRVSEELGDVPDHEDRDHQHQHARQVREDLRDHVAGEDRHAEGQISPTCLPAFSILSSASSMSASVWVAMTLVRMHACPPGTAGGTTGLAKTPWSKSDRQKRKVRPRSPTT